MSDRGTTGRPFVKYRAKFSFLLLSGTLVVFHKPQNPMHSGAQNAQALERRYAIPSNY
jgi:hypothetical protein